MNENKEALLLRLNKEMQVEALNEVGFAEVTFDTPLSDFAKYIKWAGGLLDLRIVCIKLSDGEITYFTGEDWVALPQNVKTQYNKIGACIRARKREFVIAQSDCVDSSGGYTFKWGAHGNDIKDVKNYGLGNVGIYDIETGKEDTIKTITYMNGVKDSAGVIGAPAAEAAWNYKANEKDPLQWHLPSIAELRLIAEYKKEINDFFNRYFGAGALTNNYYWSSTEYNTTYSWSVLMTTGLSHFVNGSNGYRNLAMRVRAVALVK